MKVHKEKLATAILQLHSSILNINDYREFPAILEAIIKPLFHIDWLGMFTFTDDLNGYNVVTNPSLPFDWNEKYAEISDFDVIKENAMAMEVGETYIHDTINEPNTDEEVFLLETVKKYTDTSQFLGIHTVKTQDFDCGIGFYRTDDHFYFTRQEKKILDQISPVLVSICHMMHFYRDYDFKRVAINELRKNENALTITLNENLIPVDIPKKTKKFLKRHFPNSYKFKLPDFLEKWIQNTIAPERMLKPNAGPWKYRQSMPGMNLYCKAYTVVTELKQLALLIKLIPHGEQPDFTNLKTIGMTKREVEVISFLPLGYSNRQIAMAMDIEEVTVKKHLKNASQKLGVLGKTELLYQAISKKNLIDAIA